MNRKDYNEWIEFCELVAEATPIDLNETEEDKGRRIQHLLGDYSAFCSYYFPHYVKSESAWFHKRMANKLKKAQYVSAVWEAFRGAAKSTHADVFFPLYWKASGELNYMLLVGETEEKAKLLLSDVQAELQYNQRYINDFGEQMQSGEWSEGRFQAKDGTYFSCIGLGQSPRGIRKRQHRPDYIVVDDCDSKKRSANPRRVREAVEWILEDLMGCFSDLRQRFLLVNNRIHKQSILAGILEALPNAYHLQVNALDKEGKVNWPQKYTKEYWDRLQEEIPHRSFQREYMNNPIEDGTVFQADWIRWKKPLQLRQYDTLCLYGDLSYTENGDYKAIHLVGKKGREFHILEAFVRKTTITNAVQWCYDLYEDRLQHGKVPCAMMMEGNFIQDKFINEFDEEGDRRGYYLPVVADRKPKANKYERIEGISPFWEKGMVYYNEKHKENQDFTVSIDQTLAFEKGSGAHDDAPDSLHGAISELMRRNHVERQKPRTGKRRKIETY
ncbi:phage terminase large subunit [Limibacter armeniacum]|uniref:phage terminase large subunit n=1 Tax=Limibacter armeniacum TaxID=466084 RepID=UPI002FE6055A